MINKFLATVAVLGVTTLSTAIPSMANTQPTLENHSNYAGYWLHPFLMIQTYTTAPTHTLEPTAAEP